MRPELLVSDDPAAEAAERLVAASGQLVLTGGSTPRAAYERAAMRREDWSDVTVWFSDERCVPPDHEHSNYGMVKAALFDRIQGAGPQVERMRGELGAEEGAADYERRLQQAGPPTIDFVLIGLGPDGHVCSLFPGDDEALAERERLAVGVERPGMAPFVSRITLTLRLVNAAREVAFLVTGEEKADAVARAFSGRADPRVPGSLVRPESGRLAAIMDPAAAARL